MIARLYYSLAVLCIPGGIYFEGLLISSDTYRCRQWTDTAGQIVSLTACKGGVLRNAIGGDLQTSGAMGTNEGYSEQVPDSDPKFAWHGFRAGCKCYC